MKCHLRDVTHWHWVSHREAGQAFVELRVFSRGRNIAVDYMTWIASDRIMPPYMFAQHLMHWSSPSPEPQDITVTQVLFMLATETYIMGEEREKEALLVNEFECYVLYSIKHLNINRDCIDLNTQQRGSVPGALFSIEILIFRAYTCFIHICGSNLLFSTRQLLLSEWWKDFPPGEERGCRIALPNRAQDVSEGTTAYIFNPLTSFHSLPELELDLDLTVWDCLRQAWYFSRTRTIACPSSTEILGFGLRIQVHIWEFPGWAHGLLCRGRCWYSLAAPTPSPACSTEVGEHVEEAT